MSGILLEILVGHCISMCLVGKWLMCVPYEVYKFISEAGRTWKPLTGAVKRELRWMISLLPLARKQLDRGFSARVLASDASGEGRGSGYGLVSTTVPNHELIHEAYRYSERWRWRELPATEIHERNLTEVPPRDRARLSLRRKRFEMVCAGFERPTQDTE